MDSRIVMTYHATEQLKDRERETCCMLTVVRFHMSGRESTAMSPRSRMYKLYYLCKLRQTAGFLPCLTCMCGILSHMISAWEESIPPAVWDLHIPYMDQRAILGSTGHVTPAPEGILDGRIKPCAC